MKNLTAYITLDNPDNIKPIYRIIKKTGIKNTLTLADGLDSQILNSADIIITDNTNLTNICSIYSDINKDSGTFLPLLLVTNDNSPDDGHDCITDVIHEPVSEPEWISRIKTYLKIRQDELRRKRTADYINLFNSLFINYKSPAHIVNGNMEIVAINNSLLKLLKKNIEEVRGKKCYDIFYGGEKECDGCIVKEAIEKKTIVTGMESHTFVDGVEKYFEKRACPLFDNDNNIEYVIVSANEITDKKQKQIALEKSEEMYRSFIEKNIDPVILINKQGVIKYVNQQVEQFGYSADEVLGTSILNFLPEKDHKRAFDSLKEVLYNKEKAVFEGDIIHKDGSLIHTQINGTLITYNGEEVDLATVRNINKLKETEDNLRKNSETLNNIFNNSVVAIYVQERNGTFIDVNKAAVKLYGFKSKSDLIGKNPSLVSDESKNDISKISEYMEMAFAGEPQSFVFWGKKVDGTSFPKLVTIEKGSYFGRDVIFAYAFDISELTQVQDKYRTIFQTSPDAIAINKMDTTFVEVNSSFLNMFSLTQEKVIGRTTKQVGLIVSKEDIQNLVSDLKEKGFSHNLDFTINMENKKVFHTLMSTQKIEINGEPHFISIIKDITTLKETEKAFREKDEHYKAIVDNIDNGIYIYDGKKLNFVNERLCEIVGYSMEEMFQNDVWSFFHQDDKARIKQNAYARLSGKEISKNFTARIICKDGTIKSAEFAAKKIIYHGKPAIMGIVRDITDRLEAEKKLIRARDRAEESNRLKSAFLNNMNHELRTPMNAIMGFSELMDKTDCDQKEQFASIIRSSAKQLLTLMDDVLYLSRLQSEKLPIKNTYFSPYKVITDIVDMLNVAKENENVEIIPGNPDNLADLTIYADMAKIRQVLTNLASNAIKHTFEGSVEIGFFIEEEKKEIEFYVKDTGIGIPEDEQDKIFETFYRGRQATSAAIRGTGLGLSIAKQLTEQIGGTIGLTSDLGRGSYFHINLPLRGQKSSPKEKPQQPSTKMLKGLENISVLIAEDDPNNYLLFEILLKKSVKVLDHAWNGKDAVDMVDKNRYDIVFMDIKMPIMNGIEATKIIKQKYPDLPIIAQTAYTSPDEKRNILNSGCSDYLAKPIKKSKLMNIIKKYI